MEMTEKRFTNNGIEEIENQSFTDNLTGKTYWIDNGFELDSIADNYINFLKNKIQETPLLKKEVKRVANKFNTNEDIVICLMILKIIRRSL